MPIHLALKTFGNSSTEPPANIAAANTSSDAESMQEDSVTLTRCSFKATPVAPSVPDPVAPVLPIRKVLQSWSSMLTVLSAMFSAPVPSCLTCPKMPWRTSRSLVVARKRMSKRAARSSRHRLTHEARRKKFLSACHMLSAMQSCILWIFSLPPMPSTPFAVLVPARV